MKFQIKNEKTDIIHITCLVSVKTHNQLKELVQKNKMGMTHIIRQMVEYCLKEMKEDADKDT